MVFDEKSTANLFEGLLHMSCFSLPTSRFSLACHSLTLMCLVVNLFEFAVTETGCVALICKLMFSSNL